MAELFINIPIVPRGILGLAEPETFNYRPTQEGVPSQSSQLVGASNSIAGGLL